jgi:hypothetical protein
MLVSFLHGVDSGAASNTDCVPPPSDLVGWWPGDGNGDDLVGGNDGIISPGTAFAAGKVGQAFSFNGTSDYVTVPDDGLGSPLDGFSELTIDAWVNPDSIGWPDPESGGNISAIVSKHDTTKANGVSYSLLQFNGKLRFVVLQTINPDNKVGVISDMDIPIGVWSHVAAVWRGGTDLELYWNGTEITATLFSEGSTPTMTADNDVPVNIGRVESFSGTHVGPAAFFHGLIDEVEIFDRALSASEILAIYNAGSDGKCKETNGTSGEFVYIPIILKPPPIVNGDFEAGPFGWGRYSSNGWPLIVDSNLLPVSPHSGFWAVWMGGDFNEDAVLWQVVKIPADEPTLKFWLWIASQDVCGYDVAGVAIDLDEVVDAFWLCSGNNTGGWIRRTVDLSAYAGQTVELDFVAFTDDILNSNLFIDDVSLGNTLMNAVESSDLRDPELDISVSSLKEATSQGRIYRQKTTSEDFKLDSIRQEMQITLSGPGGK